jgi:hypothetical protein
MPRDWFFINRIALSKFSDERDHLINASSDIWRTSRVDVRFLQLTRHLSILLPETEGSSVFVKVVKQVKFQYANRGRAGTATATQFDQNHGGTTRNADLARVPAGYQDSVAAYYRKHSRAGR